MVDVAEFLQKNKSMIIAPAGFGKTHTIINCLAQYQETKKILILTHTHAGVASIREKIKANNIASSKYQIDTICSFALQLAQNYHINKADFPNAESTNEYFNFAISTSVKILKANPVKDVIRSKFSHIIVDEYQDCSLSQHQLILCLSSILKTHILGDPLQGIFQFRRTQLVDMITEPSMAEFRNNTQELDIPWRWNNANTPQLGADLTSIRRDLMTGQDIDLRAYHSIITVIANERDYAIPRSIYKNTIWTEINNHQVQSLLLIHPISENEGPREKFIQQFPPLRMIESIDNKDYYEYCKQFDTKNGQNLIVEIIKLSRQFFLSTILNIWFKPDNTLKLKRDVADKEIMNDLHSVIAPLLQTKNYQQIANLILQIKSLPGNNCRRQDFIKDIINVLRDAHSQNISAYEAMKRNRDIVRREGRNIIGKYIGTTLLTKGLEFDAVVILNAHKFKNPKHLYVALTRACKRLVVITENPILHPY